MYYLKNSGISRVNLFKILGKISKKISVNLGISKFSGNGSRIWIIWKKIFILCPFRTSQSDISITRPTRKMSQKWKWPARTIWTDRDGAVPVANIAKLVSKPIAESAPFVTTWWNLEVRAKRSRRASWDSVFRWAKLSFKTGANFALFGALHSHVYRCKFARSCISWTMLLA